MTEKAAPGQPGTEPYWTNSVKVGVGTSLDLHSRIWYSLSRGVVTELYYPYIDKVTIRQMEFLVTDGESFFSSEKQDTDYEVEYYEIGVPLYKVTNTCVQKKYKIEKLIFSDCSRDLLIVQVKFCPLQGELSDYRLYIHANPHLGNQGTMNNGWVGEYKGIPMLFAEREGIAMALASDVSFSNRVCGYVGASDGWEDLEQNKRLTWFYTKAEEGNVALTGEIDLESSNGEFNLFLAFGGTPNHAGQIARASMISNLDHLRNEFLDSWRKEQEKYRYLGKEFEHCVNLYRTSIMVMKVHQTKVLKGSMIASLSIPWGGTKGDNDLGGYHLIWPRDLVESAGGLLASGDNDSARNVLLYMICTQEEDGHWSQCMWVDGTPYWTGIQMDETAMPILLASTLKRYNALGDLDPWPMVKKAARYIVQNGPVTQEDRWEENGGFTPFTLATEIAALLEAAVFHEQHGLEVEADYLRETADAWNDHIERWIYVEKSKLAEKVGVDGYYVRITPLEKCDACSPTEGFVPIKNRPPAQSNRKPDEIVSTDALALVRFGLRRADDPKIRNTVAVIDHLLKKDTKNGLVWYRYNEDGYGEHEDGSPFDGTGRGRGWPLLGGERGHYELARGNIDEAYQRLLEMEKQANASYLIPEQIWESEDISEKNLINGEPTGGAMPLVWAHAEYVKLLRSLEDRKIFDLPRESSERYIKQNTTSDLFPWRFNLKCLSMPAKKRLRIEVREPARIRWSMDQWETWHDAETKDTGLGTHYVDLPTKEMKPHDWILFTFYWLKTENWEGENFEVMVES